MNLTIGVFVNVLLGNRVQAVVHLVHFTGNLTVHTSRGNARFICVIAQDVAARQFIVFEPADNRINSALVFTNPSTVLAVFDKCLGDGVHSVVHQDVFDGILDGFHISGFLAAHTQFIYDRPYKSVKLFIGI